MRATVVEVGPDTVRGDCAAPIELLDAAMDYLDDEIGLLDERVVSMADVWVELMRLVVGSVGDGVVLVCPTWWCAARIDRVRSAAESVSKDVAVLSRGQVLADRAAREGTAIVEIAEDLVVVTAAATSIVPVNQDLRAVAATVHAALGRTASVLIDAPTGVSGAVALGSAVADQLGASGIVVAWADEGAVRRAGGSSASETVATGECRPPGHRWKQASVVAGVVTAVLGCAAAALLGPGQGTETTVLVEGRIAVTVPGAWPMQRITSGPGSARLQLVSPSDDRVALHLTQSMGPPQADLATAAASLRTALATEPDGVFADFMPADARGGRPAVTYRELRPDRHVDWTVIVDAGVRIAIGCQSPPARPELVRVVCERAIASAHAVP